MKNKLAIWFFAFVCAAVMTSCKGDDGGGGVLSTTAPMIANFDPSKSVIPFPNNLLFSGSTDGTLNIPVVNAADITDPKVAMNTLDGFSTVAPISTTFSLPLSAAGVATGVRVFEVSTAGALAGYAVTGIVAELTFGVDFVAGPSPSDATTLAIKALKPLKSNTNYMVVVTNAVVATSGQKAGPSAIFTLLKQTTSLVSATGVSQVPGVDNATAAQLEKLRQLTGAMLLAASAAAPAINPADVAIAWSFKTQTLNQVLPAIQADSLTNPYTTAASFIAFPVTPSAATNNLGVLDFYSFAQVQAAQGTTALLDGYANPTGNLFANIGSVVIGAVKVPYYLDDTSVNPLGPVVGQFQFNAGSSLPITKSVQTIPFILTTPLPGSAGAIGPVAAGPWPVVIFQHGFTVSKSVVFGIANTLAKAGFATIAIDSVLHGDRTFKLDLVTEVLDPVANTYVVTANVPDGTPDSSGTHYLNLSSLLTARDNIRQSVADLIHLTRLIENQTMDVVNNTTGLPGADATSDLLLVPGVAGFVGHSNGGILGTMLAAVEPAIPTFVLANPGGVYSDILQNSIEISPKVNAGLTAKGVTVPSADYFAFLAAAQTVVDDGDPINYGAAASAKNILLFKQLGDKVVPNASTDLLSAALLLPQVATTATAVDPVSGKAWPLGVTAAPFAGSGFTFFTQGSHSSFLTPVPAPPSLVGLDVITEMQTETAFFLGTSLGVPPGPPATIVMGATALPSGAAVTSVVQ